MIDPELRDIKCEWLRLPGSPEWMRHLSIAVIHGDNSVTKLLLTEKQAIFVGDTIYPRGLKTLCSCGHALSLHDDQAVCRALVEGRKSCQCMQYSSAAGAQEGKK